MSDLNEFLSQKLTYAERAKVLSVAQSLNIDPNHLLAVIYFETARTMSPSKTNHIGSVGLLQFTRDKAGVNYKTINGKVYQLAALAQMNFVQQMDVVKEYYTEIFRMLKVKSVDTFIDLYLATFFPVAVNKPADFVLKTSSLSASLIAKQNPIFDANKDGQIQKHEIVNFFKGFYKGNFDPEQKNQTKTFCSHCGKALTILVPLIVFFYSVATLKILLT